jgi:MoaA/NifB/PqqE/SkfB family radical SAM enzyme
VYDLGSTKGWDTELNTLTNVARRAARTAIDSLGLRQLSNAQRQAQEQLELRQHAHRCVYEGHLPSAEMIELAEKIAARATVYEFSDFFDTDNRMMRNFALSVWEKVHGKTVLKSYPWNISIPVADLCNARCNFCTSWLEGKKVLELEQLDLFEQVIRRALFIGLVGHGEPLAHPRFEALCDRLQSFIGQPSSAYTITNGALLYRWLDRLPRINLQSYSISLNAATPETHDVVMGLGKNAFPRITESIGALLSDKSRTLRNNVYITMVVTKQNIAEVPGFIELGNKLGVTQVVIRNLLPQPNLLPGLNYHLLAPYDHPDFDKLRADAIAAANASQVPVEIDSNAWGNRLFSPALEQQIRDNPPTTIPRSEALRDYHLRHRNDRLYWKPSKAMIGQLDHEVQDDPHNYDNPYGRKQPYSCKAPYYNLYIHEMFFRMSPCCFMQQVPGYKEIRFDGSFDFQQAWNSAAMMRLRWNLKEGPLFGACRRCPEKW